LAVEGANRRDVKLARATLQAIAIKRPQDIAPQALCLDKGYDSKEIRRLVREFGFVPHIRSRGEERQAMRHEPDFRPRCWVVERTHSWMNRFRRILVRWEKRLDSYMAMLHLALGIIAWRSTGLVG
jgi:transposase